MEKNEIMLDHPELKRFQKIAGLLASRSWAEANAGNLSTRIDKETISPLPEIKERVRIVHPFAALEGSCYLVTATKSRARDIPVEPEKNVALVEIGEKGEELICRWGAIPPTSEFPAHLAIHAMCLKNRDDIRSVLHTHPPHLIGMSHMPDRGSEGQFNRKLRMMHPEVGILMQDGLSLIDYEIPGSLELGLSTCKALENRNLVIWPMHGVVSIAQDLDKALDQIEILEKAAFMYLLIRSTGQKPIGLANEQIRDSRGFWGIKG
jgi:rhamnulose-1-phosphate aldolase